VLHVTVNEPGSDPENEFKKKKCEIPVRDLYKGSCKTFYKNTLS
jgi:hypothetical protein